MAKKKKTSVGVLMLALLAFIAYSTKEKGGGAPETRGGQPVVIDFNKAEADARKAGTDWLREKDVTLGRTPGKSDAAAPATDRRGTGPFLAGQWRVGGLRIVDARSGKTLPITEMDLKPTLDRIERGERHSHRNDGSVYRNLNRQLPRHPDGYYREYVVPTPGLGGPGPQRLVIGQKGEVYYTWDHYDNFIQLK